MLLLRERAGWGGVLLGVGLLLLMVLLTLIGFLQESGALVAVHPEFFFGAIAGAVMLQGSPKPSVGSESGTRRRSGSRSTSPSLSPTLSPLLSSNSGGSGSSGSEERNDAGPGDDDAPVALDFGDRGGGLDEYDVPLVTVRAAATSSPSPASGERSAPSSLRDYCTPLLPIEGAEFDPFSMHKRGPGGAVPMFSRDVSGLSIHDFWNVSLCAEPPPPLVEMGDNFMGHRYEAQRVGMQGMFLVSRVGKRGAGKRHRGAGVELLLQVRVCVAGGRGQRLLVLSSHAWCPYKHSMLSIPPGTPAAKRM